MIGERAGLPPEKVQALIAGLYTSFDKADVLSIEPH
jgi:hypothetical protein